MDSGLAFREFLVGDAEKGVPGILDKLDMSVEQFAHACGVTRASIYYYIGGKSLPSTKTIHRIAKVVDMLPSDLIDILPTREEGRPKQRKTA